MTEPLSAVYILGIIVLLVLIGVPVYILVLATLFSGPSGARIKGVFFGTVLAVAAVGIAFAWLIGAVLSLVMPT